MNRRQWLTSAAAMASGVWRSKSSAHPGVGGRCQTDPHEAIEMFNTIEMPATQTEIEAGVMNRASVTRVVTESGVRGYSFTAAAGGGRGGAAAAAGGRGAGAAAAGGRGGRGGGRGPNPAAFQKMQQP